MKYRANKLASVLPSAEPIYFALWVVVLIVAVILQVLPVLLVVMMVSLAIGIPQEIALNVVPVVFIAMLYLSCRIASKFAQPPGAAKKTGRSDADLRAGYFQ